MPKEADRRRPLAGEPLSITVDDFPCQHGRAPGDDEKNLPTEILAALERAFARYPAARPVLFVNSDRICSTSYPIERLARVGLLGNHTASHCDLDSVPLDLWRDDVVRCQRFIDPFLPGQPRFFRFPFLRTGNSRPIRDAAYRFLLDQGLIVLPGSCPTADWQLACLHDAAHQAGDRQHCQRIERSALMHIVSALKNAISERASSPIPTAPLVLVLHANRLLAAIIEALLETLRELGATFADAPASLSSFDHFNGFDEYVGTWGGSFFLQCSADGCDALASGQDWLSRQCAQIRAEYGGDL